MASPKATTTKKEATMTMRKKPSNLCFTRSRGLFYTLVVASLFGIIPRVINPQTRLLYNLYWYGVSDAPTAVNAALNYFHDGYPTSLLVTPWSETNKTWCDQVAAARELLDLSLQISYPCEGLRPATSVVVCMLTGGVSDGKASLTIFTARNYIEGAMALGYSLQDNIDNFQTHMLLLLREGFELAPDDLIRLKAVGWMIGTAPDFGLLGKYVPRFPRYKTTYTKVTAIGLEEYKCAMLMDADTLVTGDLRPVLTCDVFKLPQNRVGGTLDLFRKKWYYFNTGSILWRTSSKELNRVHAMSRNSTFMKRFSSDQDFLNNVYPERLNKTLNELIVKGELKDAEKGAVVPLSWNYNAQTHVEVHSSKYWEEHRLTVKILHFTQKKGWQCDERHNPPPPMNEMPNPCVKEIPICFCREAHLYWNALNKAKELGKIAASLA